MDHFRLFALLAGTILICGFVKQTYCSNILVIIPHLAQSHYNVMRVIMKELSHRNHNLTVLTPFDGKDLPKNVNIINIDIVDPVEYLPEEERKSMFDLFKSRTAFTSLIILTRGMAHVTKKGLQTKSIQDFIKYDNTKFDLVIVEDFYFNAYYMFAHKYKAPLITYSPSSSAQYIHKYMGNSLPMDYISHEYLFYPGPMSMCQKIVNILFTMADLFAREWNLYAVHDQIAAENFKNLPQPLPTMKDLETNISLVFLNSHFSMDTVKSIPPNIVEIGGAHMKQVEKLPEELKLILDNSEDGFIYFSLGSILRSSELPQEKMEAFFKALSGMKHLVLMKWESDILPNISHNIIARKWLPQNDILAHPKIRLFLTHGGILSLQEAMYHGVPIVGVPVYTDQPLNVAKAKYMGFGEGLDFYTLTEEAVRSTVEQVLNNPRYAKRAKEVSAISRDKPLNALDTAIFWIEYVIRHKGAQHLKLISSRMPWYEYYMLDIILVFVAVIILIYISLMFVIIKLKSCIAHKLGLQNYKTKRKVN